MRLFKLAAITIALTGATAMAGCATIDRKVDLLYNPVAATAGMGSGDLFVAAGGRPINRVGRDTHWVIGTVKNSEGEKVGTVTSSLSPDDLVLDALKEEFTAAGYSVIPVSSLPAGPARGVDLARVSLSTDETTSVVKSDAAAAVSIVIDVWRDGQKVDRLEYGIKLSDFAVKDRAPLCQNILRQALQDVMHQAVPQLTKLLQKKS